ncbi:MAG: PilW family protein [Thermodesulfobacteriota bacterium]
MVNTIIHRLGCKRKTGQEGFTLIELLVAMGIASIVLVGIYRAYESQVRSSNTQRAVVELHQNLRTAMYYLMRDIRMAGYDPTGRAGAGFVTADVSTISFSWDVTGGEANAVDDDGDGTVDNNETYDGQLPVPPDFEGVTYTLAGTDIQRDGVTIAENINSLVLTYLDENDAILATPVVNLEDIRKVQINIVGAGGAVGMGSASAINRTLRLMSEVKVRNIALR